MSVRYVGVDEAVARSGLRMVVVGGVPSLWSEAAKAILHIKGIPWVAVRLAYDSEALKQWAGQRSAPVVVFGDEEPRSGWREILALAERLAPTPALLPADADARARAQVLELSEQICDPGGLGWTRRLQLIHAGLNGAGGFAERVAAYLGKKYGYTPEAGAAAGATVVTLLGRLATALTAQRDAGMDYFVGDALTAADVYAAAVIAMFCPLPQAQCPMDEGTRAAFETLDAQTAAALAPVLLEHRDMMYARHLELPLSL